MYSHPAYEVYPEMPYHDFWLLREDAYHYEETRAFWGRKDSPIKIPDETLHQIWTGLRWVPTLNPGYRSLPPGYGLKGYGPTVINSAGAVAWAQVMRSWAQLFAVDPPTIRFSSGTHNVKRDDGSIVEQSYIIKIDRDLFVADLLTLAEWGDKAATGDYFILHLGI